MSTSQREQGIGWALLLLCVVIWGINGVAFKIGVRPPLDPILLNGVRFLVVAPLLALIVALTARESLKITRADALRYTVYGFVAMAVGETMITAALQFTSVANMALLGPGTISLFTAIWATLLGEQALTRLGWFGAAVALMGVAIVAGSGSHGFRIDPQSLIGDSLALGRSVIHSLYLVFLTRTLREKSALTVTLYNLIFGALWFLPYVLYKAPSIAWRTLAPEVWWAILWTIFPTTLFGYWAWNLTMRRMGAVSSTNVMYLLPVTSALAAWGILHEPLRLGQVLGGGVIVIGIVLLRASFYYAKRSSD